MQIDQERKREILRLLQREIQRLQAEKLMAQIQDNVRHAREVQSKWPI